MYSDEAIYVLQAQRLRWHLSFVRGTKELMLRSNVHRQKPSHFQPVFVSVSAPFQCPALRFGRPCQPQGLSAGPAPGVVGRQSLERAAACTSLVLMEKMLVYLFIFHASDLSIRKMGQKQLRTSPALVHEDVVLGYFILGLP